MPTNTDFTLFYEKRLVAFIDVMGFKELLYPTDENLDRLREYYGMATDFLDGKASLYRQTSNADSFKKLLVSDSVIMSVELSDDKENNLQRASRFFSAIGLLQYILAVKCNIWTRGAVSVGNLYIEESKNILVGPAFVQAYELEKLADYPRVIVDPRILKFFDEIPKSFVEKINQNGFQGRLLGVNLPGRFDISPFINDAIQIDWFRHALGRTESLDSFFKDIRKRQMQNQSLFQKSNRLMRYLIESNCLANESGQLSPTMSERSRKIESYLNVY